MPVNHHQHRRAARCSIWLALAALAGLCLAASPAEARPRPQASSFSANKTFGLGIMVGAPTAISGKYYLSADTAIDFGLGVIRGFGRRNGLHLHADFLWHPATLVSAEPFVMPFYLGLGGRIADFDRRNDEFDDELNLGVRAPLGLMLDFNNVPLDIFFELALVIDFIGYDGVDADFNGALGVRYYFM